jgi:hypothetical protein
MSLKYHINITQKGFFMNFKQAGLLFILISLLSLNSCTKKQINDSKLKKKDIETIKSLSKSSELFDSKKWSKADMKERYKYTNDLITNKRLENKFRSEIIAMIGTPDLENGNLIGYKVDIGDKNTPVWYLIVGFDSSNKTNRVNLSDRMQDDK